jgi:hypothetical protein
MKNLPETEESVKPKTKESEKDSTPLSLLEMSKGPVMMKVEAEIDSMNISAKELLLRKQKYSNRLFFYGLILSLIFLVIWLLASLKIFIIYQPALKFFIALADSIIATLLFVMFKMTIEKTQKTRKKREIFLMFVTLAMALMALSFI